jgi:ferredoxin-type protein NapH
VPRQRSRAVPEDISPAARRSNKAAFLKHPSPAHRLQQLKSQKWRNRRWATLIFANLLFVISFALDIQILEGALTASRFVGFHLIDLNSALQVMLAHKHIINNLLIGTGTVLLLWVLLGGRTFCSWICPYHLLAEWAEKLHLYLAKKSWSPIRSWIAACAPCSGSSLPCSPSPPATPSMRPFRRPASCRGR